MANTEEANRSNDVKVPSASAPAQTPKQEHDILKINTQFAERYDASQRLKILREAPSEYLKEDDDASSSPSSSEEEDEFGELLTKGIDRRVHAAIEAIRKKDPRLYDGKSRFFDDPDSNNAVRATDAHDESDAEGDVDSDDEPVAGWDTIANAAKANAPKMTMKDYVRENVLNRGTLSESDDEGDAEERPDYEHERDEVAKASHKMSLTSPKKSASGNDASSNGDDESSENEDGDDADFFSKKKKTQAEIEAEEKDFEEFIVKTAKKRNKAAGDDLLLHSYLENETPDEKERFLRDFILNNGWLDKNTADAPGAGDYAIEVDLPQTLDDGGEKDEEFNNKQDEFEAEYNFRFEDPNAEQIVFHPRKIKDSVRRPKERRKNAREARAERKEQEKAVKTEEIKRLKNLKKREIQARLLAIKEAAGDDVDLTGIDLEGDFDPEEFNRQMEQRFGDDYYGREDEQMDEVTKEGVATATEKRLISKDTEDAPDDIRADVNKMMDEYYNLDYEDIVGGTPMRFNYKRVEPESFNLTTEQILEMDDKELNGLVSLKYLAPYRAKRDVQKQAWRVKNSLMKKKREPGQYDGDWEAGKRSTERNVDDSESKSEGFEKPGKGAEGDVEGDASALESSKKRKKRRKGHENGEESASQTLAESDANGATLSREDVGETEKAIPDLTTSQKKRKKRKKKSSSAELTG